MGQYLRLSIRKGVWRMCSIVQGQKNALAVLLGCVVPPKAPRRRCLMARCCCIPSSVGRSNRTAGSEKSLNTAHMFSIISRHEGTKSLGGCTSAHMSETISEKRRSVIGILAVNRRRDPQSRVPLALSTLQLTPYSLYSATVSRRSYSINLSV